MTGKQTVDADSDTIDWYEHRDELKPDMVFEHGRDADAILECCAGHPSTRRRDPSTDIAG